MMPIKRYIFPDPLQGATCKLQPDSLPSPIVGVPSTHPVNGAPCISFDVPDSVPNENGAWLRIEWDKSLRLAPYELHGILNTVASGGGGFQCDIFKGQKVGGSLPRLVPQGQFLAQEMP